MAKLLRIHSAHIKDAFENTPPLLPKDQEQLFELPPWVENVVRWLHTNVGRLGFILQLECQWL